MFYNKLDECDLPKVVDHIDGNPSNNKYENLRGCTSNKENLYNCKTQKGKSIYKGVTKGKTSWLAYITVNRKQKYLGSYKTEKEAAIAYDEAAATYFGKYAWLNKTHIDMETRWLQMASLMQNLMSLRIN